MRIARAHLAPLFAAAAILAGCAGSAATPVKADASSNGGKVELIVGQTLELTLASNPSTGYQWRADGAPDAAVITPVSNQWVASPGPAMPGRGGVEVWVWTAKAAGSTSIRLGHFPPASNDAADKFAVDVVVR